MYPIFDPSKLDDEQLFNKLQEVRMHLGQHTNLGHDSLIHSMEISIAVMEEELETRQLKAQTDREKEFRKKVKRINKHPTSKPQDDDEDDSDTITIGHIEGIDD